MLIRYCLQMICLIAIALASSTSFAKSANCDVQALSVLPEVTISAATHETIQQIDGDRLEILGPVPHCWVRGVIGNTIGFELHLPDDWNGKFLMGGGGGFVGTVINYGLSVGALNRGYATVGTDTGHRGNAVDASWAFNNLEALVNFGHQAVHRTAVNAKFLIEAYYGRQSDRNLFVGCSRGGGQALIEAQRYPDDFDAIYAGAPALNWTHELGASWTRMMMDMFPDPAQIAEPVIGPEALQLLADAVMSKCDVLDGLEDRMLNDPRQCDFDVRSLTCESDASTSCLSDEQVAAAEVIYADFEVDGQIFHGTPVGAEWPEYPRGWQQWYTGGYTPGEEAESFHAGTESDFPLPPMPNAKWGFTTTIMKYFIQHDPDWTYEGYDFADFGEKAARVATTLNADSPDLSAFRARGGKLIIDNGWMDGSMSAYNTIAYYQRILEFDPSAKEDVRLFVRPGVAHCVSGPGPDGTDYIAALENWLDTGEAPDVLPAPFIGTMGNTAGGGRIICAHPTVVTYDAKGDPRDPASFSCLTPD